MMQKFLSFLKKKKDYLMTLFSGLFLTVEDGTDFQ